VILPPLAFQFFYLKMAVLRQNSIRPVFSIIYSTRSPLVAMMQPSDFSDLNHRSALQLSFAKTGSSLVSTTWEMGCNVVELGYMRPRRGILESDDILAKDNRRFRQDSKSSG
jgi:hypothetical protein